MLLLYPPRSLQLRLQRRRQPLLLQLQHQFLQLWHRAALERHLLRPLLLLLLTPPLLLLLLGTLPPRPSLPLPLVTLLPLPLVTLLLLLLLLLLLRLLRLLLLLLLLLLLCPAVCLLMLLVLAAAMEGLASLPAGDALFTLLQNEHALHLHRMQCERA